MSMMVVVRLLLDPLARRTRSTLAAQFYYSISQSHAAGGRADNHWMAIVEVVFRNLVATQRPRTTHIS